jgi:DNA gyrase/topoisomerase IV subunit B
MKNTKYKKLDDVSHVLLRPGMYIGSIKPHTSNKFIFKEEKMVSEEITYNPGFLKIFDEIITNSVDESKREGSTLTIIKVTIKNNQIIIWDNGGIPVQEQDGEWIPEMIFSNLKAGSNFDDTEDRTGAGTNGVGSTLTNIYSINFTISTCDGKKSFLQTFSNNMRDKTNPVIKKSKVNHTQITYQPDYEKFGLTGLDDSHFQLIQKRVIDIAGCNPNLQVFFNDEEIKIKSFQDYIKYYKSDFYFETNSDRSWSVALAPSNDGFQQISFVNSTETYDGGTHIDYVLNQILVQLRDFFQKKHKVDIKPSELKNHISIYINSTIVNPSFSSQTKEKLITEVKDFGFTFEVSEKLIKWILKSEIVDSILDWIQKKKNADESKLARELNKNLGKLKVDKLIDAKAKERWRCSLSIFEGDCLHEDTEIRVIRDGDIIDEKIKNLTVEDLVITHNNSISNIYALTKKIKKQAKIKIKGDEIICSHEHKWFIYDRDKNEFYFEQTKNIDPKIHKLVKNYLAFTDGLLSIEESDGYTLKLSSGDMIETNPSHKFAVYDKEFNRFEMIESSSLVFGKHYLVNTFKL